MAVQVRFTVAPNEVQIPPKPPIKAVHTAAKFEPAEHPFAHEEVHEGVHEVLGSTRGSHTPATLPVKSASIAPSPPTYLSMTSSIFSMITTRSSSLTMACANLPGSRGNVKKA